MCARPAIANKPGGMKCKKCGSDLASGATVCAKCGAEVPAPSIRPATPLVPPKGSVAPPKGVAVPPKAPSA